MENEEEKKDNEQRKSQNAWDIFCLSTLFIILIVCCYLLLS